MVETGLRLTDGSLVELDVLIFATGFDAVTGALMRIDPVGRNGLTIREKWGEAVLAYLGVMVAGFPNMFLINGPGSPSLLYNMVPAIEHHVDWIADTITYLREHDQRAIEPEAGAEREWTERGRPGRRRDGLHAGELVVHGQQRAGQGADVPRLGRWRAPVLRPRQRKTSRTATRASRSRPGSRARAHPRADR